MSDIRVYKLNNKPINKQDNFVLYWVQNGLRIKNNFALEFAISQANKYLLPLLVYFGVYVSKNSNLRQYAFLLDGILEFKKNVESLGCNFFVEHLNSFSKLMDYINNASVVVTDYGYFRRQRYWRKYLSEISNVAFYEVVNDTVFPVKFLSDKKVSFAFQLRKKIFDYLDLFRNEAIIEPVKNQDKVIEKQTDIQIRQIFDSLKIDKSVPITSFIGGESNALRYLDVFIEKKLCEYKLYRSHPDKDYQSNLSPYLHFGFISPLTVVNKILEFFSLKDDNVISFFNELLVWRELSRNLVTFDLNYDNWKNLPEWAIQTLNDHLSDNREYIYSLSDLENARTHDEIWNACQLEMIITGKMHNYMRMYWAKKVIEWFLDWKDAYTWLVYQNDKFELDGRDPNGYAGIAWSFGQFDHPWKERKIFGKVRYMSEHGIRSKFNISDYIERINKIQNVTKYTKNA